MIENRTRVSRLWDSIVFLIEFKSNKLNKEELNSYTKRSQYFFPAVIRMESAELYMLSGNRNTNLRFEFQFSEEDLWYFLVNWWKLFYKLKINRIISYIYLNYLMEQQIIF